MCIRDSSGTEQKLCRIRIGDEDGLDLSRVRFEGGGALRLRKTLGGNWLGIALQIGALGQSRLLSQIRIGMRVEKRKLLTQKGLGGRRG